MARLNDEELSRIKRKYNVSRIWSFSRISTYMTSKYEYALHYVMGVPEDRQDCAYTSLGSIAHDALDDYYEGKISYDQMAEQFNDGWLTVIDIANLKLDRNDAEHDEKLKVKYKENMQLFFKNHVPYSHKLLIEKPVIAKVGNNVFVGYADAIYKDDDENYVIVDFKTSSSSGFSGDSLKKKSMQLTIYAMALIQSGIELEKVRCCFNMLKYVNVETTLKNGNKKIRQIERCKLGEALQANARMHLKDAGYSEKETDSYLMLLLDTNNIESLPEEVQAKYKVDDCHIWVPLTQELIDECKKTVVASIQDICAREADYKKTGNDRAFFDSEEDIKKESYYFSTLMAYSPSKHKPYSEYLDKLEAQKNGQDIFGGLLGDSVMSENNVHTSKDICYSTEHSNNSKDETDLSWLDDLGL